MGEKTIYTIFPEYTHDVQINVEKTIEIYMNRHFHRRQNETYSTSIIGGKQIKLEWDILSSVSDW